MDAAAYAHPTLMVAALALAVYTLRQGLRLRRARVLRQPGGRPLRRRHVRSGRISVVLVLLGLASGWASLVWIRRDAPFESVHFLLVLPAALGLGAGGVLGLRLERRARPGLRGAHAWLAGLGLLLGLAGGVAGFAILP